MPPTVGLRPPLRTAGTTTAASVAATTTTGLAAWSPITVTLDTSWWVVMVGGNSPVSMEEEDMSTGRDFALVVKVRGDSVHETLFQWR